MKYPILIDLNTFLIMVVGIIAISYLAGEDHELNHQATKADKARIMAMTDAHHAQ